MKNTGKTKKIELLAPAKNAETGIAAINCGTDAVYIGAPKFGARATAGNTLTDIEKLIKYAHKFWAKVYITINTLLYDDELEEVNLLIKKLYNSGADAIIIQDLGILEFDLPPIPVFASTQMHNNTVDKVKFLENIGIQRVILARELSLIEIHDIRKNTNLELEFFVHGALCVSYSGQCYFSHALFKRSGNRGECAQPCRMPYSLEDSSGQLIIKEKYLLSLKDLNLSSHLEDLIAAGITSFKIEGRLKDCNYVKNITSYYRQKIDKLLEKDNSLERTSSGKVTIPFTPDPERTFNRGYTNYFINGRQNKIVSLNTQKSVGKFAGKVTEVKNNFFVMAGTEQLQNGDGICFLDRNGSLQGMNIIRIETGKVYIQDTTGLYKGAEIFRNRENDFKKELNKKGLKREIEVSFHLYVSGKEFYLYCEDEDGNRTENRLGKFDNAQNPVSAKETIIKQLKKSGDTDFYIRDIKFEFQHLPFPFIPVSRLNEIRREILDKLENERNNNYPRLFKKIEKNNFISQIKVIDYKGNVTNKLALNFHSRHGIEVNESGFELLKNISGKVIMKCKYCIKDQFDMCPKKKITSGQKLNTSKEPLYIVDRNRKYKLEFDCKNCEMSIKF